MKQREINTGYLDFVAKIGQRSPKNIFRAIFRRLLTLCYNIIRLVIGVPTLILYSISLIVFLRLRLQFSTADLPDLHRRALGYVPQFIEQYPLHLYPILAKSLELAFIMQHLPERLSQARRTGRPIIEFAVGDGTLSAQIFPSDARIVAFDLNPYSLIHTQNFSHIEARIVADCFNPPVSPSAATLLVCNNLLHHITYKDKILANWSQAAEYCITNENTPLWASSWVKPYILRKLGLISAAERLAHLIATSSLQSLKDLPELERIVKSNFIVVEQNSYYHEKVFFLSAVCSALMGSYGPPTPALIKALLNRTLRFVSHPLTRELAKLLIIYDGLLDRSRDVFVSWTLRSKHFDSTASPSLLACPECWSMIVDQQCKNCGREYPVVDGMLFLLDDTLRAQVMSNYSTEQKDILGGEHL